MLAQPPLINAYQAQVFDTCGSSPDILPQQVPSQRKGEHGTCLSASVLENSYVQVIIKPLGFISNVGIFLQGPTAPYTFYLDLPDTGSSTIDDRLCAELRPRYRLHVWDRDGADLHLLLHRS